MELDDTELVATDPCLLVGGSGTGGTTGLPKGVQLTTRNLETMTTIALMSYPFSARPTYLALAPLTHAAGVLSFPVLTLGGQIVIMAAPDIGEFLRLIERHRVTHTMLTPTLLYMLLGHDDLDTTDLSSIECFWYGSAPMSAARLEGAAPDRAGLRPVLRTDRSADGGHHDGADRPLPSGRVHRGGTTVLCRSSGTVGRSGDHVPGRRAARDRRAWRDRAPQLTGDAGLLPQPFGDGGGFTIGWHHTGDIGYTDDDGFLFIVDRAKDMIITGGFNVYSAEVEQAVLEHPSVQDCAKFGVPDEKWGERVTAVVQLRSGASLDLGQLRAFVRERVGGVKAPKAYHVWDDLPRSKVGKVLKREIRAAVLSERPPG